MCFSKSSCATRLKARAATVLSRRGAVIPHVQREQHQPLKSSPSTQIRCLFIHLPLCVLDWSPVCDGWDRHVVSPTTTGNLPRNPQGGQVPKVLLHSLDRKVTAADVQMPGRTRGDTNSAWRGPKFFLRCGSRILRAGELKKLRKGGVF